MKINVKIYLFLLLFSCSSEYNLISNQHQVIDVKNNLDSSIVKIINPYKIQLDKQMDEVISYTKSELKKGKPESKLGNFICDLSLDWVNEQADFCIFNNGGFRDIISKGNITIRDIYKVMPFENELVILELNNNEYYNLLQYITKRKGEPFGGANIIEKNDTVVSEFNSDEKIKVLTTDYLANGGDNMSFFINKNQKKLGVKLRDVIIDHCRKIDTIDIKLDDRYIIENDK